MDGSGGSSYYLGALPVERTCSLEAQRTGGKCVRQGTCQQRRSTGGSAIAELPVEQYVLWDYIPQNNIIGNPYSFTRA